jgi:hypothetical protein
MPGPKVLVGIPQLLVGIKFAPFEAYLDRFQASHRCVLETFDPACETAQFRIFRTIGGVVVRGRNEIVREALRMEADYIWFLDDDQPFQETDVDKLLAHDLDAVIPLSCRRGAPFLPLIYDRLEQGHASQRFLLDHESGLIKVAGAGMAGLLIRLEVLKRMGADGWFEFYHPPNNFDDYAEDFPFYKRLAELGYQLYCDLDVRFGHEYTCVVYPVKQQGKWYTALADDKPICLMPQMAPPQNKLVFPSDADRHEIARERERRRVHER